MKKQIRIFMVVSMVMFTQPGVQSELDTITIQHLLSDSSGLTKYSRTCENKKGTEKEFIDLAKTYTLDFKPGSSWSYSKTGNFFLGFIIGKLTGLSYEKAIQDYIFKPLSMQHSTAKTTLPVIKRHR